MLISRLPFSSFSSKAFPTCRNHSCEGASMGTSHCQPAAASSENLGSRYTGVDGRRALTDSDVIIGDSPDAARKDPTIVHCGQTKFEGHFHQFTWMNIYSLVLSLIKGTKVSSPTGSQYILNTQSNASSRCHVMYVYNNILIPWWKKNNILVPSGYIIWFNIIWNSNFKFYYQGCQAWSCCQWSHSGYLWMPSHEPSSDLQLWIPFYWEALNL